MNKILPLVVIALSEICAAQYPQRAYWFVAAGALAGVWWHHELTKILRQKGEQK